MTLNDNKNINNSNGNNAGKESSPSSSSESKRKKKDFEFPQLREKLQFGSSYNSSPNQLDSKRSNQSNQSNNHEQLPKWLTNNLSDLTGNESERSRVTKIDLLHIVPTAEEFKEVKSSVLKVEEQLEQLKIESDLLRSLSDRFQWEFLQKSQESLLEIQLQGKSLQELQEGLIAVEKENYYLQEQVRKENSSLGTNIRIMTAILVTVFVIILLINIWLINIWIWWATKTFLNKKSSVKKSEKQKEIDCLSNTKLKP